MKLTASMLVMMLTLPLAGCFVRTGPPSRTVVREERASCPPAHHWEGGACVHNGNGRGNGHGHGHDRD